MSCEICGKTENLKLCGRCLKANYCGREHQQQHWRDHKRWCIKSSDGIIITGDNHDTNVVVAAASGSQTNQQQNNYLINNYQQQLQNSNDQIHQNMINQMVSHQEIFNSVADGVSHQQQQQLNLEQQQTQNQYMMHDNQQQQQSTQPSQMIDNTSTILVGQYPQMNVSHIQQENNFVIGSTMVPQPQNNQQQQQIYQQQQQLPSTNSNNDNPPMIISTNIPPNVTTSQQQQRSTSTSNTPDFASNTSSTSCSSYNNNNNHINSNRDILQNLNMYCQIILKDMNKYGFCVIDDFLQNGDLILNEVSNLYDRGLFQAGQVVNIRANSNSKLIRGDRIIWVEGNEQICSNIGFLIRILDSIISRCNALAFGEFYKYKITRRTRAMIACYPGNYTKYVRHVDNPNNDGRCITSIYYLNKDYNRERDGGVLRLFPQMNDGIVADIEPRFNRVIFFWSDRRNPHEVMPSTRMRFAITVWYFDANERAKAIQKYKENSMQACSNDKDLVPF